MDDPDTYHIKSYLNEKEQQLLQTWFPEFIFKFDKKPKIRAHALAAESRNVYEHLIVHKYINMYEVVKDIGGNQFRHVQRSRDIHTCNPFLSYTDVSRANRTIQNIRSWCINNRRTYADAEKYIDRICYNKGSECHMPADVLLFIHSLYDMDIEEVFRCFATSGAKVGYATINEFHHGRKLYNNSLECIEKTETKAEYQFRQTKFLETALDTLALLDDANGEFTKDWEKLVSHNYRLSVTNALHNIKLLTKNQMAEKGEQKLFIQADIRHGTSSYVHTKDPNRWSKVNIIESPTHILKFEIYETRGDQKLIKMNMCEKRGNIQFTEDQTYVTQDNYYEVQYREQVQVDNFLAHTFTKRVLKRNKIFESKFYHEMLKEMTRGDFEVNGLYSPNKFISRVPALVNQINRQIVIDGNGDGVKIALTPDEIELYVYVLAQQANDYNVRMLSNLKFKKMQIPENHKSPFQKVKTWLSRPFGAIFYANSTEYNHYNKFGSCSTRLTGADFRVYSQQQNESYDLGDIDVADSPFEQRINDFLNKMENERPKNETKQETMFAGFGVTSDNLKKSLEQAKRDSGTQENIADFEQDDSLIGIEGVYKIPKLHDPLIGTGKLCTCCKESTVINDMRLCLFCYSQCRHGVCQAKQPESSKSAVGFFNYENFMQYQINKVAKKSKAEFEDKNDKHEEERSEENHQIDNEAQTNNVEQISIETTPEPIRSGKLQLDTSLVSTFDSKTTKSGYQSTFLQKSVPSLVKNATIRNLQINKDKTINIDLGRKLWEAIGKPKLEKLNKEQLLRDALDRLSLAEIDMLLDTFDEACLGPNKIFNKRETLYKKFLSTTYTKAHTVVHAEKAIHVMLTPFVTAAKAMLKEGLKVKLNVLYTDGENVDKIVLDCPAPNDRTNCFIYENDFTAQDAMQKAGMVENLRSFYELIGLPSSIITILMHQYTVPCQNVKGVKLRNGVFKPTGGDDTGTGNAICNAMAHCEYFQSEQHIASNLLGDDLISLQKGNDIELQEQGIKQWGVTAKSKITPLISERPVYFCSRVGVRVNNYRRLIFVTNPQKALVSINARLDEAESNSSFNNVYFKRNMYVEMNVKILSHLMNVAWHPEAATAAADQLRFIRENCNLAATKSKEWKDLVRKFSTNQITTLIRHHPTREYYKASMKAILEALNDDGPKKQNAFEVVFNTKHSQEYAMGLIHQLIARSQEFNKLLLDLN